MIDENKEMLYFMRDDKLVAWYDGENFTIHVLVFSSLSKVVEHIKKDDMLNNRMGVTIHRSSLASFRKKLFHQDIEFISIDKGSKDCVDIPINL